MQSLDVSAHDRPSAIVGQRSTTFPPPIGINLFRDADVFGLREEPQSFFAPFAADAALFHSAKGDTQVAHEPAIHPDRASVNLFGDAMSTA